MIAWITAPIGLRMPGMISYLTGLTGKVTESTSVSISVVTASTLAWTSGATRPTDAWTEKATKSIDVWTRKDSRRIGDWIAVRIGGSQRVN